MQRFKKLKKAKEKKQKTKRLLKYLFFFFFLLLFSLLFFVFFKVNSIKQLKYVTLGKDSRFSEVRIIDNRDKRFIKIYLDNDIDVLTSRNFGEYKLGNVWKLDQNEKLRGKLVVETITYNFNLPIYLYKADNLGNLSIFEYILASLYERKILRSDFVEFSLAKTNSKQLDEILAYFYAPDLVRDYQKVRVIDATGNFDSVEKFSKVINSFGIKINDYERKNVQNEDCIFKTKIITFDLEEMAKVFSCNILKDENLRADLEIFLGFKFAQRF